MGRRGETMKNFPVRFLEVMVGGAAILVNWLGWFMWKEIRSGLMFGCGDVEM